MTKLITYKQQIFLAQATIGGKARNLSLLNSFGLNVPEWLVIPAETFHELTPEYIKKSNNSEEFLNFIDSVKLSENLLTEISDFFKDVQFLAVRSSAIDEDGENKSFAGQFESYLFVTKYTLEEKIKAVWKSAFSKRVEVYKNSDNEKGQNLIAVIVQRMIPAEVSGVAFGINPVTGNRKEKVISSVFGLGEGIVSGELDADNYIVSGGSIAETLALKKFKIVQDESGGTKKVELNSELSQKSSLEKKYIVEIVETLENLHKKNGKYQDIEFAVSDGKLYILQTRPITTLDKLPDPQGKYIVWDNSNIIESYPGLTSPLTYSFIVKMYDGAYRQLLQLLGVSQDTIDENAMQFSNMLGLIRGRVYYNLYSWYKILSLLPGYSINAEFMEKMMGVKEKFELDDYKKLSKFHDYMRIIYMIFNMLYNLKVLRRETLKFSAHFEFVMQEYSKIDFDNCRAEEIMNHYRRYEKTLLSKWKPPLVNDFFAMIFFGSLQKMITKYKIEGDDLHNKLLSGAKDIISTEPARRILEIAKAINSKDTTKQLFLEKSESEILQLLKLPENAEISTLVNSFISDFGDRAVGELKLETITYKQQPEDLIKVLKSYTGNDFSSNKRSENAGDMRTDAEKAVKKAIGGKLIKSYIFSKVLSKTRTLVSNRENLRFFRTRGYGMVRKMFLAMGKQFYNEGIIENERDIFWLTQDEIFNFIEGKSVNTNLRELINYRKAEYSKFELEEAPAERFSTFGTVSYGNTYKAKQQITETDDNIKGLGCCPGIVKAKVRVVMNPNEIEALNGEILVTSSTDPGWITLFPSAMGILVERGSLLSHSAIVSREMGIPCVVGITNLLQKVKTGDLVEMDGSSGIVNIIEKSNN